MSKIYLFIYFGSFCWLIFSCNNSNPEIEIVSEYSHDPLEKFNDFPDSLFGGIYFNQPISETQYWMTQNDFELLDSSGVWRYLNPGDSTEILLPFFAKLSSFKLILCSTTYLSSSKDLQKIFLDKSSKNNLSKNFDTYEFETPQNTFKLSMFKQPDYLRLNFELKLSK